MQPDSLELKVRAVCGFLLGCLVAFGLWLRLGPFDTVATVLVWLASLGICTFGAVRYGDRFWTDFLRWMRG